MAKNPTICLNMIVKNEAHIIHEVFEHVAPFISSYVIVDTGSTDGTQDVIRNYWSERGIPGEVHERPWVHFGHNRSEALVLAQNHADYIWVIDADDLVIGELDLSNLEADVYALLYMNEGGGFAYWRPQIFKDGLPWRYEGVVHEFARIDIPCDERRLGGDYHIMSRRLGNRNADYVTKYERDRDLLLAEMERDANDSRSAFYLAQSYFDLGDFANAALWYGRRSEMGGWDEEIFMAKRRYADSLCSNGAPWAVVQDAYLRAWISRPTRAEPLYLLAHHLRWDNRFQLGYLFAERAAQIPLPVEDALFVLNQVFEYFALETQAACAARIGKQPESFDIYRELMGRTSIADWERARFAIARDELAPVMIATAASYPAEVVEKVTQNRSASSDVTVSDVTVTITGRCSRESVERTLNSFLNCCTDIDQVGRFVLIDDGLAGADLTAILAKYPFVELASASDITGRFVLHLEQGWRFFSTEPIISRLTAIFDADPDVSRAIINWGNSFSLCRDTAAVSTIQHTSSGTNYVIPTYEFEGPIGPVMTDNTRPAYPAGTTATLDQVLCVAGA